MEDNNPIYILLYFADIAFFASIPFFLQLLHSKNPTDEKSRLLRVKHMVVQFSLRFQDVGYDPFILSSS